MEAYTPFQFRIYLIIFENVSSKYRCMSWVWSYVFSYANFNHTSVRVPFNNKTNTSWWDLFGYIILIRYERWINSINLYYAILVWICQVKAHNAHDYDNEKFIRIYVKYNMHIPHNEYMNLQNFFAFSRIIKILIHSK